MRKAAHGDARETRSGATLEAGPFLSLDRQSILEQPTASKPGRASSAPWLQYCSPKAGNAARSRASQERTRASRAGFQLLMLRCMDGRGGGLNGGEAGLDSRKTEKRGVPRLHGKHAAWELLSPDLRCFC